jgi:hypothetical protein
MRVAPQFDEIKNEYTAASKMAKVTVTSQQKTPTLKEKNGEVKTKKNMLYNFTPAADNITGVAVTNGDANNKTFKLEKGTYEFWFEGGKKAPSAKQPFTWDK